MRIDHIDETGMECDTQDGLPHELRLAVHRTDGPDDLLVFEATAIRQLAKIFRSLQRAFPGALSDH